MSAAEPATATPTRHLSHSQLETWDTCPRRWWLEKVAHVPRAPNTASILGRAFHAAVEADGKLLLDGERPFALPELTELAEVSLAFDCAEQDPWPLLAPADRDDMRRRVIACLRTYVRTIQLVYRPIAAELELKTPLPEPEGWELWGTLDALVDGRDRGKGLSILDWKTAGRAWWTGDEHKKAQAAAYLLLAEDAAAVRGWPEPPRQVVFNVFTLQRDASDPNGAYVASVEMRPTTRTDDQLQDYIGHVVEVAEQIVAAEAAGDFPTRPGKLCAWCGVRAACAVGKQWLAGNGVEPVTPLVPDVAEVAP